jgi:hypothetical protein
MEIESLQLGRYGVAGRSGTTAATIDHCYGALFNPHATKDIFVILATYAKITGSQTTYAQRTSTRGTVGSTVTPDIDNDFDRLLAPISGAVLDLAAYSVQPTRQGPDCFRFINAQSNAGVIHELWFGDLGLRIPAGTGLGVFQGTAAAGQCDLTFIWDE